MTNSIDRLTAALSDRYRVERELGAGGMATVYLAHDLKHQRDVAIKVLHPDLGAALGSERFLSEIRTTARLQHPHILPLLDSGESDGLLYYVMPLVTGETLRTRLERERQLPIEAAVLIAREVADALGYAHSLGVIHRDIKPENVLLQGGHALVADFGIALAVQSAGGARMTQTGLSLGTPQYMSPEQAMGERAIDARSDIYALGAVTYEMLAGDPPFTGSSVQAIVAKIMTEKPTPVHTLRDTVPDHIEQAVLTALAKLPADRFESARAFADALANPMVGTAHPSRAGVGAAPVGHGVSTRRFQAAALLAVLAIVAAAGGWLRPAPEAVVSRQRVTLWRQAQGDFLSPGINQLASQAAIAPDGSSIVFSDSTAGGLQLLRKLRDQSEPIPLPGTEGALSPFFSPDGAWIGYLSTDGTLRKVLTAGGGSVTLTKTNATTYFAAAWLDDNTIVYIDGDENLRRVSADGGPGSIVVTDSTQRTTTVALSPLPGGRGFLLTTCPGNCVTGSSVSVFDFATDSIRELVADAAGAWYSRTGHLLYTDRAGGLYAAGFDLKRLVLTSGAVPVVDNVSPARFAVSASGAVLYSLQGGAAQSTELRWVSRDGSSVPLDSSWRGEFEYPAVSPDGNAVAVSLREGSTHLWIRRADGTRRKLTQSGTVNWRPSWAQDGQSIVFVSNMRGAGTKDEIDVYQLAADGSSPPRLVHRHLFGLWEAELSQDGQWLVVRSDEANGEVNIRARRMTGDTSLIPVVIGHGVNLQAALSPDGRWLAYVTNPTGERELYVVAFPAGGTGQLVSRGGGTEPRWAHSGRELFFKSGGRLMSVAVTAGTSLAFGVPRPLFALAGYRAARNRQQYDVAPDDQRFLMIRSLNADVRSEAVYVENWFTELKAKVNQ